MTDDAQAGLLARHLLGDAKAFAELVQAHQGPLLRHARSLLGPGSAYEDVVQETFLRLAQKPPDIGAGPVTVQLSSWLHKVTRNLCMDVMRADTRRKRREHEAAMPEATGGGINAVEAADTKAAVERTLQTLPQDQREVLVLRLLGEKSYREIAEITGKKIGTVGWLVSIGLKALSAELQPLVSGVRANGGTGQRMVQGEA